MDVGAGLAVASDLKKVASKVHYVGFEPFDPEARMPVLPKFAKTEVHPFAISKRSGNAEFYVTKKSACSSLLRPNMDMFSKEFRLNLEIVEVLNIPIRTLDSFDLGTVDVLKIDVQGHAMEALLGAEETLKNTKVLIVECEYKEIYEGQSLFPEVLKHLCDKGFILKEALELHNLGEVKNVYGDFVFINNSYSEFISNGVNLLEFGKPNVKKGKIWKLMS